MATSHWLGNSPKRNVQKLVSTVHCTFTNYQGDDDWNRNDDDDDDDNDGDNEDDDEDDNNDNNDDDGDGDVDDGDGDDNQICFAWMGCPGG